MSGLRDRALGTAVKGLLRWRSRPGLVRRALAGREYRQASPPEPERVTVGLVQWQPDVATSAARYAEMAYRATQQAMERGVQFVVFPEEAGTPLLGLLPGIAEMASQSLDEALDELGGDAGLSIGDVFRLCSPAAWRVYDATWSTLAARFGVHLMAGSINLADEAGRIYNTACLYGPDGALLGTQRKLHPFFPTEGGWVEPGDELHVFHLPFGRVAIPVCMDYTYPETTRLAQLRGAEILVNPVADDHGRYPWMQARGVRNRAQETLAYGLHCCMITDFAGLHWRGRSAVFAPLGLFDGEDDVLAQAATDDQEEVVVADLDLAALRRFRAEHPLDYNLPLYERYLPGAYESYRQSEVERQRVIVT